MSDWSSFEQNERLQSLKLQPRQYLATYIVRAQSDTATQSRVLYQFQFPSPALPVRPLDPPCTLDGKLSVVSQLPARYSHTSVREDWLLCVAGEMVKRRNGEGVMATEQVVGGKGKHRCVTEMNGA